MDDEEFSFLLGKRNKYSFDVIDPREKQKLKTDMSDPLAAIFGTGHRKIQPLDTKPHQRETPIWRIEKVFTQYQ